MEYEKYNWDLEDLLNNSSLDSLFEEWKKINLELIEIYDGGNCYNNIDTFRKYLKKDEQLTPIENRLVNYISNKSNENLADKEMLNWMQKLSLEESKFSLVFANSKNIILAKEKEIRKYLKEKDLKKYTREFELIFKDKKHKLTDKEEILLTKLSPSLSTASSVYEILSYSEIELLPAKDSKGKEHKFNSIADINFVLEKSKDETLRKNAYISLNRSYIKFENSLAKTLYQNFLLMNEMAKIYKFNNYVDRVCFYDEVEPKFVDHVYSQVEKFKFAYRKYNSIENKYRKKIMGNIKMTPWNKAFDIYTKSNEVISIEDAKEMILDALAIMGDEYISVVKRAFNEKWISFLPKKGKQNGAYSIGGTKGLSKYYILMNFDKTYSSVTTLAHELGHSLNSYFIHKKQDLYCSLSIFYAEIASITNEILLNYHVLAKNKNNKNLQLKIYDEMITNFFACTTRQIMFSQTEKWIIEAIENNKPIGANELKELYANTFVKYANFSEKEKNKLLSKDNGERLSVIFRLSHFYYGIFYVYKYSLGLVAAIICAEKIYNKEEGFLNKYFEFLSSGSSLSPIETIKLLGIDLTSNEPWEKALKIVEKWILAYKKLSN